eukprot:9825351-Alexandrium_andersonii.AAC.1
MCIRDRRAHRHVSSSPSDSARKITPTPRRGMKGGKCEAVPSPAQFRLRTPEASCVFGSPSFERLLCGVNADR